MRKPPYPLVAELFAITARLGFTYDAIYKASGRSSNTVTKWKHGFSPNLKIFEQTLNAFGYRLKIVKLDE